MFREFRAFDLFIQSFIKLTSLGGITFAICIDKNNYNEYLPLLVEKLKKDYNLEPYSKNKGCFKYINNNNILTIYNIEQVIYRGRMDYYLCDWDIDETIIYEVIRPQCNLSFSPVIINLEGILKEGEENEKEQT